MTKLQEVELSDEYMLSLGREKAAELSAWVTDWFGERCETYSDGCVCCQIWRRFDSLTTILFGEGP